MAKDRNSVDYGGPLRRLVLAVLILALTGTFLLWRIDSPRVERFRAQVTDRIVPNMDWAMAPVTGTINLFRDFQSYRRIAEQNAELRRELRQMEAWKEAALQLEQENARLLDLNNVRLDPRLTYITGVVLADSGSPFRQSVLLNVGARDGIVGRPCDHERRRRRVPSRSADRPGGRRPRWPPARASGGRL